MMSRAVHGARQRYLKDRDKCKNEIPNAQAVFESYTKFYLLCSSYASTKLPLSFLISHAPSKCH